MKVVIYKRLSKEDKKKTQHGFDSQQADMDYFLESVDHEVIGSFQEFVSGGADTKPELEKAMTMCKETGATLLVAKLDRLSRRVSQIALYMEGSVDFKVACLPNADNFQLHLYAALSEQERAFIKERVKRGLAAAKAKGVKIGRANPNYTVSEKIVKREKQISNKCKEESKPQAEKLTIILNLLSERTTLSTVARSMIKLNVEKVRGGTNWTSSCVKKLIKQHNLPTEMIKGVVW